MVNRRLFLFWLLTLVAVLFLGFFVGAWTYSEFLLDSDFARLELAADSSETSYALYRYAPYAVAKRALERHEGLILQVVEDSDDGTEKNSYVRELAFVNARLSLIEKRAGKQNDAEKRKESALGWLVSSGSPWTEEELFQYVLLLDKSISSSLPAASVPGS